MFNLNKIQEAVGHNLTNSEICIIPKLGGTVELVITSKGPNSGVEFRMSYAFGAPELFSIGDKAMEKIIVDAAYRMSDDIRLHPEYHKDC